MMAAMELEKAPKLSPYEEYFWRVYHKIARGRDFIVGVETVVPKPLTMNQVLEYAEYAGLSRMRTDILVRVIFAIDDAWLAASHQARRDAKG